MRLSRAASPILRLRRPIFSGELRFHSTTQPISSRTFQAGVVRNIADLESLSEIGQVKRFGEILGFKSVLFVPLMREARSVGIFALARARTGLFSHREVELVQTFADQAVIAIENVRLFNEVKARTEELSEALQQQTAVGDVLKTISRTTFDLQPVLDTLVNTAAILCNADMAFIMRRVGDEYRAGAAIGYTEAYIDFLTNHPLPVDRGSVTGRAVIERRPVQILDVAADPEYTLRETQTLASQRTTLGVPLLRENEPIGVIVLARQRVEAFTQKQIDLVATFADQAVIAIENVRLFDELRQRTGDLSEALTYQTGSANILKVIASSPTDVGPVLESIVESACELCDANDAVVLLKDGDDLRFNAHHGPLPINVDKWPISRNWTAGRAFVDRTTVHVPDIFSEEASEFTASRQLTERSGLMEIHSVLAVPLLREGESIGVILLRRQEKRSFNEKQISLLQTFADQAVIAIGNVRLFEEVQARTRDLSEALTHQTGSAKILSVIASSPTDVQPVLKAIVESACEVCEADDAVVILREGDELTTEAHHGLIPTVWQRRPTTRDFAAGRAVIDRTSVHVRDVLAPEADDFSGSRELALRSNVRTVLAVPLLREGDSVGCIVLRRTELSPFSEKQIGLLQTFADQAVIAIGNVRLFEEVQAKTRDLTEALTYQTGSANILKVIASSPTDIKPVLQAIVESACELCGAYDAVLRLKKDDMLEIGAHHGTVPADWNLSQINPGWTAGRAALQLTPVHVHDMSSSEGDEFPEAQARAREQGHRTILSIPLLQEANGIGTLTLRRLEVNPFTEKQIALLQTFADQAVIAIGNVRLFEEVQAKTRDLAESLQFQTASSEVLKVISSSPDALQPVLDAIARTSHELCGSDAATILLFREGRAHFAAVSGEVPKHIEFMRANPAPIDEPNSLFERMIREKRTLHFANVMDDPQLSQHQRVVLGGPRALLVAPLLQDGEAVGAIVLRQSQLKPFTERQIEAIEVFADQAVIAISNVNLFEQVQQRTRELTESLQQQTATSEVLQIISASPGELAPVFEKMLENATRVCGAEFGSMILIEEGLMRPAATLQCARRICRRSGQPSLCPASEELAGRVDPHQAGGSRGRHADNRGLSRALSCVD